MEVFFQQWSFFPFASSEIKVENCLRVDSEYNKNYLAYFYRKKPIFLVLNNVNYLKKNLSNSVINWIANSLVKLEYKTSCELLVNSKSQLFKDKTGNCQRIYCQLFFVIWSVKNSKRELKRKNNLYKVKFSET